MKDLGVLGGTYSLAWGINNSGIIVGDCQNAANQSRACIWLPNSDKFDIYELTTLLPANSGWTLTSARSINTTGQIVGYGTFKGVAHAFRIDPVK